MRLLVLVLVTAIAGFVLRAISPTVAAAPVKHSDSRADCPDSPAAAKTGFRHTRSRLLAKLGSPRHRGVDLVATEGDEFQTLGGKLAYTKADKDLEDEDVEVFACVGGRWRSVGTSRTNDDGRFSIALAGARRLPIGMTDLYAHVPGDGSGVRFLGFVAARHESVIVTDIDGTITASEDAIYKTVFLGKDIAHQPGAPEALARSGKTIVYVTARGDQLTEVTRRWLADHGFPRGPLRLARSMVTLPGKRTVAHKVGTLAGLRARIAAGVGNRASDILAYAKVGLTPDRIFINLPEFTSELRDRLSAGEATAFDHFTDLASRLHR